MKRLCLVFIVSAIGCGGAVRQNAVETASADHGCPERRTRIISDASPPNAAVNATYAYWIDVCGRRRHYQFDRPANRFVDDTGRFGE